MNKRLVFIFKLVAMLAVLGFVAWYLYSAWHAVQVKQLRPDWRFAVLGVVSFAGTMLTSGLTWRWLAWRIGDRHPTIPLLAAYTFSQMGKYVIGKVMLLLMRVERTSRIGMEPRICVIATLIENAMYMVSGGLIAVVTLLIFLRNQPLIAMLVGVGLVVLLAACHPRIFYPLIDKALVRLKYPPIAPEQRLHTTDLFIAVLMFLPVWLFGGISLWCAARSITTIAPEDLARMPGAYALGVIGGMISLLPGGLGPNEGIKSVFLVPVVGAKWALGAVIVQRLFQVLVELTLGLTGGALTSIGRKKPQGGGEVPNER